MPSEALAVNQRLLLRLANPHHLPHLMLMPWVRSFQPCRQFRGSTTVSEIIDENQREFRSSLQDTFTQFMERFDALEQRGTPSTPPTPTLQGQGNPVPFNTPRDVLSRWTW